MPIRETQTGVRIDVYVQPGAKKTELAGEHGEAIKIRIHAPPVEGKANEELIRYFAKSMGVSSQRITLVRGEKSRSKTLEIDGLKEIDVKTKLGLK